MTQPNTTTTITHETAKKMLTKAGFKLGTRTQKKGRLGFRKTESQLVETFVALTKPDADATLRAALLEYVKAETAAAAAEEERLTKQYLNECRDAGWRQGKRLATRVTWAEKHHRETSRVLGWLTSAA